MPSKSRRPVTPSRRGRCIALALITLAIAAQLPAQQPTTGPRRPPLDRESEFHDVRDWRSYYECGMAASWSGRTHACFYWASRLDPTRPEPPYAEWLLSLGSETGARDRALLLDPFMHEGRIVVFGQRPAPLISTVRNRAWEAFWAGNYRVAADQFRQHLRGHAGDLEAQWAAAISLYNVSAFVESAARLRTLEDTLRRRHDAHFARAYESLHFLAYMQAVALAAGAQRDSARAAAERALAENLAFYQARMLLADLALSAGDTAGAAREWADAHDVFGADAVAHHRYAQFLLRTGHAADAETEVRASLASEPEWVDAYGTLARTIDAQGDGRRADAVRAYEEFLRRAPAEPAEPRRQAEARLQALRGA